MTTLAEPLSPAVAMTKIMNPIISGMVDTFAQMAGFAIHRKDLSRLEAKHPYHPITAVIQMSGKIRGSICLSLPRRTAFALVSRMVDVHETEVTNLVCDTVAEFANVIAGTAKNNLLEFGLELGLPNVLQGTNCEIWYPPEAMPMCANFTSDIGPLMLTFGFSGQLTA